jgi:hypothetical protein
MVGIFGSSDLDKMREAELDRYLDEKAEQDRQDDIQGNTDTMEEKLEELTDDKLFGVFAGIVKARQVLS